MHDDIIDCNFEDFRYIEFFNSQSHTNGATANAFKRVPLCKRHEKRKNKPKKKL